jgi:hypothetical protein
MKHLSATVFLAGLLLLFGIQQATSAQSREISFSEVNRMEQTALGLLQSIPYRSTLTAESFPARGKEASWKGISILEKASPDRSRQVYINVSQGKSERREIVSIGGNNYQRFDGGPWQVLAAPARNRVGSINEVKPIVSRPRVESKTSLIETIQEKGRLVSIYEVKNTTTREVDGKEVVQIGTSRYWFRDDGMLLKKLSELETVGDPKIVRNTTVYEYDNVKVEAPVINE